MKKILFVVALALSMSCVNGANRENSSTVGLDERIVQLTPIEWDSVKKAVDRTNFCHMASHNTTIIVTNSVPAPETLPIGRLPRENDWSMEFRRVEPTPYVGQDGWNR